MKIALGQIGMRPDDFWNMSIQEFFAATEGFHKMHDVGPPPPMGRDELNDLMERFPD